MGPGTITVGAQNLFNFAPLNYFQRPDERYIAGAFADYEISPAFKPYLEFMFMDDRTLAQIAPSGDFGNTLTINCDNPLISRIAVQSATRNQCGHLRQSGEPDQRLPRQPSRWRSALRTTRTRARRRSTSSIVARATPTTRPSSSCFAATPKAVRASADLRHQSWRGVLGMRGDLSNVFSYDTYFQYGRTNYTQVYENEFSISRLQPRAQRGERRRHRRSRSGRNAGSSIVCRSVLDNTDPTCVPYDPFGAAPSAAAINYLNVFGVIQGITSEQIANFNVTGLLGEDGLEDPVGRGRHRDQRRRRVSA